MTKTELKKIRARCEAAEDLIVDLCDCLCGTGTITGGEYETLIESSRDIPVLLDEIHRLQKRIEAFERAVNKQHIFCRHFDFNAPCNCAKHGENWSTECKDWQFDEARFSKS
jgi:hypothetical protein